MPNDPDQEMQQRALSSETLARFQNGGSPRGEIKRLLAAGLTPDAAAQVLRGVHAELQAERDAVVRQSTLRIQREVARAVVAGQTDGELERSLLTQGLDREGVRGLIHEARVALRRTCAARGSAMWPHLGARLQTTRLAVLGIAALIVLGSTWSLGAFVVPPAQRGPSLTAMSMQTSVSASMEIMPNAIVIANHLNVRVGPSPDDPVIVRVKRDMQLEVIAKAQDAQRLKVKLPDNREGWIRNDPELIQLQTSLEQIPFAH